MRIAVFVATAFAAVCCCAARVDAQTNRIPTPITADEPVLLAQLPATTTTENPPLIATPGWDPYVNAPVDSATMPGTATLYPPIPLTLDANFRWRVFGEFLYLRAGDAAATSFAIPIDGSIMPEPDSPIPVGPIALIDPSYEPGLRVGFGFMTDEETEWGAMYTHFESKTSAAASVDPADVIVLRSLVVHPASLAADIDFFDASASGKIEMDLADIEYRKSLAESWYRSSYVLGARYAHLDQDFNSEFTNATTIENVDTSIQFDGGGLRGGLEAEWHARSTGFMLYSKGYASLVAGRFRSSFEQRDNFLGTVATTSRTDDRVVPILDLELGLGWRSQNDRWRITAGYLFSSWFNVVSNEELIEAVHSSKYRNLDDTLTFDGLAARAEIRF